MTDTMLTSVDCERLADIVISLGGPIAEKIAAVDDLDVDGLVRSLTYRELAAAGTYAALEDMLDVSLIVAHEEGRRHGRGELTAPIRRLPWRVRRLVRRVRG